MKTAHCYAGAGTQASKRHPAASACLRSLRGVRSSRGSRATPRPPPGPASGPGAPPSFPLHRALNAPLTNGEPAPLCSSARRSPLGLIGALSNAVTFPFGPAWQPCLPAPAACLRSETSRPRPIWQAAGAAAARPSAQDAPPDLVQGPEGQTQRSPAPVVLSPSQAPGAVTAHPALSTARCAAPWAGPAGHGHGPDVDGQPEGQPRAPRSTQGVADAGRRAAEGLEGRMRPV